MVFKIGRKPLSITGSCLGKRGKGSLWTPSRPPSVAGSVQRVVVVLGCLRPGVPVASWDAVGEPPRHQQAIS